jgi:uncharacterized protein YecE (DUF72 family)
VSPAKIYIGTSGWIYKSWAETFYPHDCAAKRHLEYYATRFPTVEINATFYRLPEESTFDGWCKKAPEGFLYAVKGSRAVTHLKRLKPGARSFKLLLDRSRRLRNHLGPYLWQLPPNFSKNAERLGAFLKTLPRHLEHAVEFRHASWFDSEISALLKRHKVAMVAVSSRKRPMHWEVTSDFVYIRFHGLESGPAHNYTDRELEPWAEHLRCCARQGIKGYVYFNNDVNTRAPVNALRLMEMVGKYAVKVPA